MGHHPQHSLCCHWSHHDCLSDCLLSFSRSGNPGLLEFLLLHGGGHRGKEETDAGDVDDPEDDLLHLDDRDSIEIRP